MDVRDITFRVRKEDWAHVIDAGIHYLKDRGAMNPSGDADRTPEGDYRVRFRAIYVGQAPEGLTTELEEVVGYKAIPTE